MTDLTERVYALSRRAGLGSGPTRFVVLAAAVIGAFVFVAGNSLSRAKSMRPS